MSAQAPPVTDERDALRAYLVQQQDAFRSAVVGLTDQQAGLAPTPSSLCLGALLKHVTMTQEAWCARALAAPSEPIEERSEAEQYAAHQAGWTWTGDDTLLAALADFDRVSAGVLDAVGSADLDAAVPVS